MQKASVKLMFLFLCTVCLIVNAAWIPAEAGAGSVKVQVGGPQKPPKPGPSAPDGGNPLPCIPDSNGVCPPST